jgi:hypothetical protein
MEPEGSLPHSQEPSTCPYPEPAKSQNSYPFSVAGVLPKNRSRSEALQAVS